MKKLTFLLTGLLFVLGACSGNNAAPPAEKLQVTDVTLPDTYDEALAQASYKKSCASCHGVELEGAPAYPMPITEFSKEEVYISIVEGMGLMPANMVSGEEAKNLAVWIAAQ